MADISFDDLIPEGTGSAPPSSGLSFDDLIPEAPDSGPIMSTLKRTGGQLVESAGRVAEDIGNAANVPVMARAGQAAREYGQGVQARNPAQVGSVSEFLAHPVTGVEEAVGQMGAQIPGYLASVGGGRLAGGALGSVFGPGGAAVGSTIGGYLGGLGYSAGQEYSEIRNKQDETGAADLGKAAAGALAAGAVENVGGVQRLLRKGIMAPALKQGESRWLRAGKSALRSGLEEGAEEIVQSPIEQVAGGQDPGTPESLAETAFGGLMGFAGGAPLGGFHGVVARRQPPVQPIMAPATPEYVPERVQAKLAEEFAANGPVMGPEGAVLGGQAEAAEAAVAPVPVVPVEPVVRKAKAPDTSPIDADAYAKVQAGRALEGKPLKPKDAALAADYLSRTNEGEAFVVISHPEKPKWFGVARRSDQEAAPEMPGAAPAAWPGEPTDEEWAAAETNARTWWDDAAARQRRKALQRLGAEDTHRTKTFDELPLSLQGEMAARAWQRRGNDRPAPGWTGEGGIPDAGGESGAERKAIVEEHAIAPDGHAEPGSAVLARTPAMEVQESEADQMGEASRLFAGVPDEAGIPAERVAEEALPPVSGGSGINVLNAEPAKGVDVAAHEAATSPLNERPEPTEGQKEAGNYAKGHTRIGGLEISIENPEGSTRSGTDRGGKPWSVTMQSHYGYVRGSVGKDKDPVDTFVKPGTADDYQGKVFVIDQEDPKTRHFDEHKAMIGYGSEREAWDAYHAHYEPQWRGAGGIHEMAWDQFREWVKNPEQTRQRAGTPNRAKHSLEPTDENQTITPLQPAADHATDQAGMGAVQPEGLPGETAQVIETRQEEAGNAIEIPQIGPADAGSSPQPGIREAGGRAAGSSEGVREGGSGLQGQAEKEVAAEPAARSKTRREESVDERSWREWGENYAKVTEDPAYATSSEDAIRRAANYAGALIRGIQQDAQTEKPYNADLLDSLEREKTAMDAEWKRRQKARESALTGTPKARREKIQAEKPKELTHGGRDRPETDTQGPEAMGEPGPVGAAKDGGDREQRGNPLSPRDADAAADAGVLEGVPPPNVPADGAVPGVEGPGVRAGESGGGGRGPEPEGGHGVAGQPGNSGTGVAADGAGGRGGRASGAGAGVVRGAGSGAPGGHGTAGESPRGKRKSRSKPADGIVDPETRERANGGEQARLPNYHLTDPNAIGGGGPRQRFARNRRAIEVYSALQDANRQPTQAERDVLAAYLGWGSFGQELFQGSWERPVYREGWKEENDWLREHLGEAAWKSAQNSIINAHYTDPPTVQALWAMVRRLGFTGGRVLEPSMGIGNFYGLMPRDLMAQSELTGIELDRVTGGMAKFLYPDANIQIKGYEASQTADDFYDLVIGNWPFAKDGPPDRRYHKLAPSLHDYFFLKALDQVRPGGIVIGITSNGTMDKLGRSTRLAMAKKANLVAAFRMPTGAFEEYAGTKVVADILVFQKKGEGVPNLGVPAEQWMESDHVLGARQDGTEVKVNRYWQQYPERILGTMAVGRGTTTGRDGMIVERDARSAEKFRALPFQVPENILTPRAAAGNIRYIANQTQERQNAVTVGEDGRLYVVQGERLAPLQEVAGYRVKSAKETARREVQVKALVGMRQAYASLIEAERGAGAEVEDRRGELRRQYEAFVAQGPINESEGMRILRRARDPHVPVLAALEHRQPDGSYEPAAILLRPTMRIKQRPEKPSIRDAFVMARNESMAVDLAQIAKIAHTTEAQVEKELLEAGAVFRTPAGTYEVKDVYLSGNVRRKLREAIEAQDAGQEMGRNIEALQQVIPPDVPYFAIEAKLGASWVPIEHYRQFVADLLGLSGSEAEGIEVRRTPTGWKVELLPWMQQRPEATNLWGVPFHAFSGLLRAALNNTAITIRYKDESGNLVVDEPASKEVNEKAGRLREEFSRWAWRDAARRIQLERAYNEVMNAIAEPQFDGSFLTFEGMALTRGDSPFSLRSHQADAIWRGIANGRGLYGHEVGTGKTYALGGIAVESRRYGIARKPLVLAHNANSASVAAEIREMYPAAKVLYVDNLAPATVDTTLRQIANDDWDAIVVPHSLIDRFALSGKTLDGLAAEEIAAFEEDALNAAAEDGVDLSTGMMDDEDAMKKVRSATAKELVKARNAIKKRVADMAARASKEGAISFEDLGIDMILVDEVHEFKKPPLTTRMKLKGLNKGTSDKSITLRFLTDYVRSVNGGRGVHLFTGTPITNTLNEIYNLMRYVMNEDMARDGVRAWDDWFNTFADAATDVELTATGEYEPVTRLSSFVNVAELRRMVGQYMHIVFADEMPEFAPRPTASGRTLFDKGLTEAERDELLNGRTEHPVGRPYKQIVNDTAEMGPEQRGILQTLVGYARDFKAASKKQRREIMLTGDPRSPVIVETNAANAGFDARLYDMSAADDPNGKVNRAVRNVLTHYREHPAATQVIFMERGYNDTSTRTRTALDGTKTTERVPKFNIAKDLIGKLVAGGVKREEIAVVTGETSKEKRKEIADAMNRSEIRVAIGSSATLGVGVNMQVNLRAMHHLDAPWMPGLLEQRNGRGHRQGNQWNTVLEYRYLTEGLDGRRWQVLAIKQKFITAFLKADSSVRIIEGDSVSLDEGEGMNDLAESLSAAAGDPRILVREKLKADVRKLDVRERMHSQGVEDAVSQAARLERENGNLAERATAYRGDVALWTERKDQPFGITLGGKNYTERKAAQAAVERQVKSWADYDWHPLGEFRGFSLRGRARATSDGGAFTVELHRPGSRYGQVDVTHSAEASLASIEGKLRALPRALANLEDKIKDNEGAIVKFRQAAETPFGQAAVLAKKTELLRQIESDLEKYPVAAPAWLRNGAATGTDVFLKGKEARTVYNVPGYGWARSFERGDDPAEADLMEGYGWIVPARKQEAEAAGERLKVSVQGHRWGTDNWWVLVDDGEAVQPVPYTDLRDENNLPVFEARPFEKPEVGQAANQGAAAVAREKPSARTPSGIRVGDTVEWVDPETGDTKSGARYLVTRLTPPEAAADRSRESRWTVEIHGSDGGIDVVRADELHPIGHAADVQFSKFSQLPDNVTPSGISHDQAQKAIDQFRAGLSGAAGLDFQVYDSLDAAFGPGPGLGGRIKGAYLPKSGVVALFRDSLDSAQDATTTLRHEVLAHYGLNLFPPDAKAAILDRIVVSRGNEALKPYFERAAAEYPEHRDNPRMLAEEVFARIAEEQPAGLRAWWNKLLLVLGRLLRKAGLLGDRVTKAELHDLAQSIAEGIRRGAPQRTFPASNQAQFSRAAEKTESVPGSGSTIHSVVQELAQSGFVKEPNRLVKAGILKVVHSRTAPPGVPKTVSAMWDGKRQVATLFYDRIRPGEVVGKFLHELGEHAGLDAMLGAERYRELADQFQKLLDAGEPWAVRAAARADAAVTNRVLAAVEAKASLQQERTPVRLAEYRRRRRAVRQERAWRDSERLAYLVELYANAEEAERARWSPRLRVFVRRLIAAIRAVFYRSPFYQAMKARGFEMQLSPADIAALARQAVRRMASQALEAKGVPEPQIADLIAQVELAAAAFKAQGSRFSDEGSDADYAAAAWTLMTQSPELYQYPKSTAKTLEGIATDIDPDMAVSDQGKPKFGDSAQLWLVQMPNGRMAYVREDRHNQLILNAADLKEGGRGSALYAALANYAYNQGKVFIGDPEGLSDVALYRRTENMLASALKFGTTRHIHPHPRQEEFWKKWGLTWKTGDDAYNLKTLLMASYHAVTEAVPELQDNAYDFQSRQFVNTRSGNPVTETDFAELAKSGGARAAQAGSATLKRTAVTNTLVRRGGEEGWRRILGEIVRQRSDGIDSGLRRISYSDEPDPALIQSSARAFTRKAHIARRAGKEFKRSFGRLKDSARGIALQGLTVRMNAELARDILPVLEERFVPAMADREAVTGQLREYFAEKIAKPFEALFRENPEEADRVMSVLQEATLSGVNPAESIPEMLRRAAAAMKLDRQPGWEISQAFAELKNAVATAGNDRNQAHALVTAAIKAHHQARIDAINTLLSSGAYRTQPDKQNLLFEERKDLQTAIGHEVNRNQRRSAVVAAFERLSTTAYYRQGRTGHSAQSLFRAVLKYEDRMADLETAALERKIQDLEMDAKQKAALIARLRHSRQQLRVQGPYIPLSRFGRFWVASKEPDTTEKDTPLTVETLADGRLLVKGRDLAAHVELLTSMRAHKGRGGYWFKLKDSERARRFLKDKGLLDEKDYPKPGIVHYERFETSGEADERIEELKQGKDGLEFLGHGENVPDAGTMQAIAPGFVAEVDSLLAGLGNDERVNEVRDAMYQAYLRSLPEVSAQKHWLHRKKTPGFSEDVLRTLATKAIHDANNIAKIKHGYQAADALDEAEAAVKAAGTKHSMAAALKRLQDLEEYQRDWQAVGKANFEIAMSAPALDADKKRGFKEFRRLYGKDSRALARAVERQRRIVRQGRKISDADEPRYAAEAVAEARRAYQDALNPSLHPAALFMNSLGFAAHMGISPGAMIVNALQTPIMSMPAAAARFGIGAANRAFGRAYLDFFRGARNAHGDISIEPNLAGDEARALYRIRRRGVIDKTLAHDTTELSNDPALLMAPRRALRRIMTGMFHHAERMNREVTFIAAYRLAREGGDDFDQAFAYAENLLHQTHYDYSQWNRARLTRGNVARVIFQFKQYSLGTTWLLGRNFLFVAREIMKALKGQQQAREVFKSEAYQTLAGIMGMQMLFAGALGLPIGGIVLAANGLAKGFDDDDDEPWEFETWFRLWAAELFGAEAGRAISKGLIPWAAGKIPFVPEVDLQSRLSMADLWIREPDRELEGNDAALYWLSQVLGPSVSTLVLNPANAAKLWEEGHGWRALEKIAPLKELAAVMKAGRYEAEGVRTLRGDELVDLDWGEVLAQALDLAPARLGERYAVNRAISNVDQALNERRQALMDKVVRARMEGDREAAAEGIQEALAFSRKHPERRITPENLRQSMRARQRRTARTEGGLYLPQQRAGLRERYDFAEE